MCGREIESQNREELTRVAKVESAVVASEPLSRRDAGGKSDILKARDTNLSICHSLYLIYNIVYSTYPKKFISIYYQKQETIQMSSHWQFKVSFIEIHIINTTCPMKNR